MNEIIVGIDLGTTNSVLSWYENSKVNTLEINGEPLLPSCVGIDSNGKILVGYPAKNQIIAAPERTIASIKRKMGEPIVIKLGDTEYSPQEISAIILRELKSQAEKFLNQPVAKAVITVPAYFNEEQRQATKTAGETAGFEVVRMIHEPTAAAVAYDCYHKDQEKILIYDLGGGTFDASLAYVEKGIVEIKASHGDTHLGGDDFDELLVQHIVEYLKKEKATDVINDWKARRRLSVICEKAKRALSDAPFVRIQEEFIIEGINLDLEISRSEYEAMIQPLVQKTLTSVHKCLEDAHILSKDLNRVMLVGGSTKTPFVQQMLHEALGIIPRFEINPELVVAMGASIEAGVAAGQTAHTVLIDITPHTFGTSTVGEHQGEIRADIYVPVIKRNSPIPVTKSEVFYTVRDSQEAVEVNIYEGEEPFVDNNKFIGKFMVKGLSGAPAGNPIVLNLALDINGMLRVTAEEKVTGLSKTVVMDTTKTHAQHPHAKTGKAKKRLEKLWQEIDGQTPALSDSPNSNNATSMPVASARAEDGATSSTIDITDQLAERASKQLSEKVSALCKRAQTLLNGNLDDTDRQTLKGHLDNVTKVVEEKNWPELRKLNDSLSDIVFYLEE